MLAGLIVEKVSGQSLRDFLQANVFSKQGMASSAVDNDYDIVPHRAQGYDRVPGRPGAFQRTAFFSMHAAQWSGGLRTTVGDLLHWQNALLSGQVVSPKLLKEMTSPARLRDGRRTSEGVWPAGERARGDYGYGLYLLDLAGHKQVIHGGGVNGFSAVASTSVDDHLSFVVLTNTTEGLSSGDSEVWIQIAQTLLSNQETRTP
jgi:CubicO group peptidase (beta-lactamase class C family)